MKKDLISIFDLSSADMWSVFKTAAKLKSGKNDQCLAGKSLGTGFVFIGLSLLATLGVGVVSMLWSAAIDEKFLGGVFIAGCMIGFIYWMGWYSVVQESGLLR